MMCSARSFGSAHELALELAVLRSSVPRGRVPAIGPTVSSRPSSRTITSGEAPSTVRAPDAQEEHVRRRVDRAQAAVDVERVGAQRALEALRQDHLDDVAGADVLLGALDDRFVAGRLKVRAHRRRVRRRRPSAERRRALQAVDELVDARAGRVVGRAQVGLLLDRAACETTLIVCAMLSKTTSVSTSIR